MLKNLLLFLLWVVCAYTTIHAQTTYMGVTLDRGKEPETNCIYIFNDNDDSVKVLIQYKIGNRNTDWIDYPVPQLIPPSILEPQKIGCIDSTIIGLKLIDVMIVSNHADYIDKKTDSNQHHQSSLFQKIKYWFSRE